MVPLHSPHSSLHHSAIPVNADPVCSCALWPTPRERSIISHLSPACSESFINEPPPPAVQASQWSEWLQQLRAQQEVKEQENAKRALQEIKGFANPVRTAFDLEVCLSVCLFALFVCLVVV